MGGLNGLGLLGGSGFKLLALVFQNGQVLLARVFDLSGNGDAPLLAEVLELRTDDLGECDQRAVVFALLGGWVWPLDAHSLKCLGLVGYSLPELVQGRECHSQVAMGNTI